MDSNVKVGDIVLYHPRIDDPKFHDKGHQRQLPAVVVKVWDNNVAGVQVLPTTDLNVLQNATTPMTFLPFVKHGTGLGEWCHRG